MEEHHFTTQLRMVFDKFFALIKWQIMFKHSFIFFVGGVDLIQFLFECGADIKAKDNNEETSLHAATMSGNFLNSQIFGNDRNAGSWHVPHEYSHEYWVPQNDMWSQFRVKIMLFSIVRISTMRPCFWPYHIMMTFSQIFQIFLIFLFDKFSRNSLLGSKSFYQV